MHHLDTTAPLSTDQLWDATHETLLAGYWSAARALLDDLGRRGDISDRLGSLETYAAAAALRGARAPGAVWTLLQDRIDQVNARIEMRAEDSRY
jgi:hypothetical protein